MFPLLKRAHMRNVLAAAALAVLPMPAMAADADWLAARDAFRRGDDAALQAASAAMVGSPLAVYGDFWMRWRGLKEADPADVRAFLAREKGSYLADKLRAEWLRQLARRSDWVLFRQEYPQLIDSSDTELLCLRLQAELDAGDASGLAAVKNTLWMTAKDQVAACDPALAAMQARGVVSEEDRWLRLRLALEANAGGLARHLLAGFGMDFSAAQLKALQDMPDAYISEADLSGRGARELAAYAYGRWARQDYMAARTQLESQAQGLGAQAAVAWRQLALAAARSFDPDVELLFARSEAAFWPDSHRELRLRQLVRQGKWSDYRQQYEQLPPVLRDSRIWRYWQARALQADGQAPAARVIMTRLAGEEDYYGLLALEALGRKLGAPTPPVPLSETDRSRLAGHPGFSRALALHALGQRWEAASEWNWAVRTADDRLLLAAAERASNIGWHDRAIYAAERTESLHDSRYRYLAPFRDITRVHARELNLDETWVYGLMRQESRFVTVARSTAGAGGLMQLMPTTAQWVTNRLGIPWTADMVNDIDQNVRLGTYYLNHVLTELGHPVLATAGYNAGPRRALEWQPDEALESARYIESIPFGETRDYVKKVMTNAVHYARAFGEGETRLVARLGTIPARVMTPIEGP